MHTQQIRIFSILSLLATLPFSCASLSRPFLYSAEKDGKKITLLGTIHSGVPIRELPSAVIEELKSSSVAFFEVDFYDYKEALAAEADEEANRRLNEKRYTRQGISARDQEVAILSQRLSPELWQMVRARAPTWTEADLNELNARGALTIIGDFQIQEVSKYEYDAMNPWHSMDFRLFGLAKDNQIRTMELDHYNDGIDVCKREFDDSLLTELAKELKFPGSTKNSFDPQRKLVEAYREGEEAAMKNIVDEDQGSEYECLLGKRNRSWAERIDNFLLRGDKAFVAVGVGHLVTAKYSNLLELLRARGFRVQRISLN